MKNCKNVLLKVWLLLTVAIVLGGVILLSVLGFNNTVDYTKGYELTVGVNYKVDNQDIIDDVAEEYLAEKGISYEKYSKVYVNDGQKVIYRFDKIVDVDVNALDKLIVEKLDNNLAVVSVEFNEFTTNRENAVLFLVLALLISEVVVFFFTLILGKVKVALITMLASIVSVVSYLGMVALFRVPICSFIGVFTALSCLFGLGLSTILSFSIRQTQKLLTDEKQPLKDIVANVVRKNLFKFICIGSAVLLLSVLMLIFGGIYVKFVALHLILASVSSFATTLIGVPFAWCYKK